MEELFEELVGDGFDNRSASDDSWYADYDYPIEGDTKREAEQHRDPLAKLGYVVMGVMAIPVIVFVCAVFATCSKFTW